MIRHEACVVPSISVGAAGKSSQTMASSSSKASHFMSLHATDLTERGSLGIDHRAIVWCHSLLDLVRSMIWELDVVGRKAKLSSTERQARILRLIGFKQQQFKNPRQELTADTFKYDGRMQQTFGRMKTVAMYSAMLYNLPILVAIYTMILIFHRSLSFVVEPHDASIWTRHAMRIIAVFGVARVFIDVRWEVISIWIFVANTIAFLIQAAVSILIQSRCGRWHGRILVQVCVCGATSITIWQTVVHCLRRFVKEKHLQSVNLATSFWLICWCIFLVLFPFIATACSSADSPAPSVIDRQPPKDDDRTEKQQRIARIPQLSSTATLASMMVIIGPCLLAGKVAVTLAYGKNDGSSAAFIPMDLWVSTLHQCVPSMVCCILPQVRRNAVTDTTSMTKASDSSRRTTAAKILTMLIPILVAPFLLQRGMGFRLVLGLHACCAMEIIASWPWRMGGVGSGLDKEKEY